MLFTCPGAVARGGGPHRARGRRRDLCVDIHCHVHVPAADEMVKHLMAPDREPSTRFANAQSRETNRKQMQNVHACLTSVEQRLRDMDRMGMDVQAISPSPFHFMYWLEPELAAKMSRAVNEHLASIVQAHPDRFVALGHVPLQSPAAAAEELEYGMKRLGFRAARSAPTWSGPRSRGDGTGSGRRRRTSTPCCSCTPTASPRATAWPTTTSPT